MTKVNEERVHEIFNTISGDYDKMNAIISFKQHDVWRAKTMKKIASELPTDKTLNVLDLCCGTGDWTFDLADFVGKNGNVTGLDFSEKMLAIAEEKKRKSDLKNVTLLQGNAMALPFPDKSFDLVTIGYGLRNTPDYLTVLQEMQRVLKAGGLAVCLETSQPSFPVYKQLFGFYFHTIMPLFGRIFAKSYAEYRWLQKSAREFPDAKKLKQLFEQAGFVNVEVQKHSGGAVASHYGYKN
ncbi:demethylmenaquinone methyltransferase [Lactococcus nasutitermitis]|uniref:Demethylmenaquinone methyltransferase n=1 Tax=Lactococcus nasutitermitis TaxID=1652957 RepID=A0ABV9JBN9_9LACT|nr:demethylmenaquinone methyltransferase [Lactococcus nasutitermitis]